MSQHDRPVARHVEPHTEPHAELKGQAIAGLLQRAATLGGGAAPVHLWDPQDCGPIPMRIAADGTWFYNGTPISRDRMVRLFATILRREPDGHFVLVTPVEKVTIEVDDAPFQAVEMAPRGKGPQAVLTFRTNVGDVVEAGPDHPIRFAVEPQNGGLLPYVRVRGGLDARLTRAAAIELADLIVTADQALGVWSGGAFFRVPAA